MSYEEMTEEQRIYMRRLALRLVRNRKSASIDEDDLMSAAAMRWWQFCIQHPDLSDLPPLDILFRQQVKFAMRDVIRSSAPVKVTRAYQAKLQAYETPYTVDLDHAFDVQAGDEHEDYDTWLDVVTSIKNLSPREQIILSLHAERDYTFTEIAFVLDVSVSTVTRSYQHAIDKIKKDLHVAQKSEKNDRYIK